MFDLRRSFRIRACGLLPFLTIALAAFFPSCSNRGDGPSVRARLDELRYLSVPQEALQEQPLVEEVPLGNVMYGKSYGDCLFFFDEANMRIYSVEGDTVRLALDKRGRGPGEYSDIGAFTYVPETEELVIFERAGRKLRFYKDGAMTRQIPVDFYAIAMEALSDDKILYAREAASLGGPAGLFAYDLSSGEQTQLLSLREDQVEFFHDLSFCRVDDKIYFGVTGLTTDIYSYDGDLKKVASVSFSPNPFGKEYWSGEYSAEKEGKALASVSDGNLSLALGVFCLQVSKDKIGFWYMNGDSIQNHNLPSLSYCSIEGGEANTYYVVRLPRESGIELFQPVAVGKDGFISIGEEDEATLYKVVL